MSRALFLIAALAAGAVIASCGDPVHDGEVTALGPEAPGVSPGPDHRPGQPCLVCHGGQGPASAQFALAGTVFQIPAPAPATGANGVTVKITDVNSSVGTATTNSVGNFYILASDYSPTYPVDAELDEGSSTVKMLTHIGRNGSCGYCHFDPPGTGSPGHVYLADSLADLPDGGAQ